MVTASSDPVEMFIGSELLVGFVFLRREIYSTMEYSV